MNELEPVWCVWGRDWWHATTSGNAPLSTRTSVRCVCPEYVWGSPRSGGGMGYRAEVRLPTCPKCLQVLTRRKEQAEKVRKTADTEQRELF